MPKPRKETLMRTGEMAKHLGVTTVTVRKYTNEFREFLSPDATNEIARHFTPEDIRTLEMVSSLLRDGYTYKEIRNTLEEQKVLEGEVLTSEEPEPPPAEEQVPAGNPSAIQPMQLFNHFIDTLNEEHQAHLEDLRRENERLQAEIEYLRLPWFRRWFARRK